MEKDFEILNDAGETVVVSRQPLAYLEREVMNRFRPRKWRRMLEVDSSAPEWADSVEYDIMNSFAQWVPAQSFTSDFAMATAERKTERYNLYEMMSGYEFTNRELIRAQELKVRLDTARAQAVIQKAEDTLEHLAATGTIDGTKSLGDCEGLYNITGATLDATASVATTAWEDLAFGTEAEQNAFIQTVIDDILKWERIVEVDTKETFVADTLVLPLSTKDLFKRTRPNASDRTLMQLVMDRTDAIDKIEFWAKGEDVGAGGKRRSVLYSRKDQDSAKFVLPKAPMPGRKFQDMFSIKTPVSMVVGGVRTKAPKSIVHCDMAAVTP